MSAHTNRENNALSRRRGLHTCCFAFILVIMMLFTCVPVTARADMTTYLYGDADLSGQLTPEDASIVLRVCIGAEELTPVQENMTDEGHMHIDANKSGTLTTADATFILKAAADMIQPYSYTVSEEAQQQDMPMLEINTENGAPIVSKEVYIKGEITVSGADDVYCLSKEPLQIRGRGNYSWSGTEKKSYRIKFDTKQNFLGQGREKAKSWTLLAVHCDKTLMRTDAAYYFASRLGNIPFVSSSSFAELTLNGEYLGVYEVCDQIQVHKGRVDIDDSGTGDDIGYLVELDKNASEDVIRISNGNTFEIKSDYVNDSQKLFIQNYLSRCYDAICTGDMEKVSELIDINSAVDCYIVEEFMKNLDVGWGSFYFTKPAGDKLYFGPVWDFDLCAGNAEDDYYDSAFKSYRYTYVGNPYFGYYQQQSDWYLALRECEWFNTLVAQRFSEVEDIARETVDHIGKTAYRYKPSFERNFVRWDIFGEKINREPVEILRIHSFDGQVEFLQDWLTKRIDWLDRFYRGEEEDMTYSFG